jgi:hypothetical protein
MSQLGRIGGQVLTDNLLRAGIDLAFETDLLYLDVTNKKIGVKKSPPVYDFDVDLEIATNDLTVTNQARFEPNGLRISGDTFTTQVGGIDVYIAGNDLFHARMITDNLDIVTNNISSLNNSNIVLDPNGTGTVEIYADAYVTGNLTVGTVAAPRNINVAGNLTGLGTLTLGDQTIDTITINTDFTQSIIPGDDLTYALGADAADSSPRRWSQLHAPDWTTIDTGAWPGSGLRPQAVIVSDQLRLDGVVNKISAIQSNDDVLLNPDTGIVYIENTKWQDSDITNLNNTALSFAATGIGYYNFNGTNAIVVPSGDNSQRRPFPEVGETRWNTEEGYLECFDGTVFVISTGGGEEVTQTIMNDLSNVYTLILG